MFDAGLLPDREIFVAPAGDDAAGDGSRSRPFRTVARAARDVTPGSAIRIAPGDYPSGEFLGDVIGSTQSPIWIGGTDPSEPPHFTSDRGIQISRATWVVIHDLEISGSETNGLNLDDGGDVDDPDALRHIVVRNLDIHDIGDSGNQDCLKLSGIRDFVVADSRFARCGGGGSGSGIDMVGAHDGLIARNQLSDTSGNGVQTKGGTSNVEIRWNRFVNPGHRGVNMGGSTGFEYFRPPLDPADQNAEARNIRVLANLFRGGQTPFAFVGCVDCLAAQNTVVEAERWLLRILQETTSRDGFEFAPVRDGAVENNLFVFRRGTISTHLNIGPNTEPETFRFGHNLWYATDAPAQSAPHLPAPETGGVVGQDPRLGDDAAIEATSPAAGAGAPAAVSGDLVGACYRDPPSIGAREVPAP